MMFILKDRLCLKIMTSFNQIRKMIKQSCNHSFLHLFSIQFIYFLKGSFLDINFENFIRNGFVLIFILLMMILIIYVGSNSSRMYTTNALFT